MPFVLSIVIPVFNAENSIGKLVSAISKEIKGIEYEIILVNDGSKDTTHKICQDLAKYNQLLKYICLRKNFGEFNAVICGLNHAQGQFTAIIDDDFQNPPSEINKLLETAQLGDFDVVYSYYENKKHHFVRNIGSNLVNRLTTFLLKKPKDLYLSSFKIIKKEVVDEIIKCKNPYPYIDGLIFQITDNIGKVKVEHQIRENGKSNYTTSKLISLFLTILFGYSLLPLRLTLFAGLLSILFSIIYMSLYFLKILPQWGSPVVIFLGGATLTAIALLGEYIGKVFMINSGKPQYVIKK
jgi:glycosyltransferase involved in cell wall biosynthesis